MTPRYSIDFHRLVRDCRGLPRTARSVLNALALYVNGERGDAFPSVATLVGTTGLSRRSVQSGLAYLRDQGLIETPAGWTPTQDRQTGGATRYRFNAERLAAHAKASDRGRTTCAPGARDTRRGGASDDANQRTTCAQSRKERGTQAGRGSGPAPSGRLDPQAAIAAIGGDA